MGYDIDSSKLESLDERIAKINKKARRLGRPTVAYDITGRRVERHHTERHAGPCYVGCSGRDVEVATVEPRGARVRLAGWRFLAKLTHDGGGAVLLNKAPCVDGELPRWARDVRPGRCDHCGARRRRNDTFLLQHDDGRYAVVGRTCLRDYTGGYDPSAAIASLQDWGTLLDILGDPDAEIPEIGGMRSTGMGYPAELMLAAACMDSRENGYVSKAKAEAKMVQSTADYVWWLVDGGGFDQEKLSAHRAKITAQDHEKARRIIWWAGEELMGADLTDYQHNLVTALSRPITERTIGIAVSAVQAYDRAQGRKAAAARAKPVHKGEIKQRLDITGTVVFTKVFDGFYGEGQIVKVDDGEGGRFVWFASSIQDVAGGDAVKIRGTVKKHDMYDGEPQTVLTRCKIEVIENAA